MSVATAEVNGTARITANPPNSTPATATDRSVTRGDSPTVCPMCRVDDVALELADGDEPEQRERGDVQGLREADGEDGDRADQRADIGTISIEPTNAPTSSQWLRPMT